MVDLINEQSLEHGKCFGFDNPALAEIIGELTSTEQLWFGMFVKLRLRHNDRIDTSCRMANGRENSTLPFAAVTLGGLGTAFGAMVGGLPNWFCL